MILQLNTKVKRYQVHSYKESYELKIYTQDIQRKEIYVALTIYNTTHYVCKSFTILARELLKG